MADTARAQRWVPSRALTFGCLLLGGLLGVVASAQPWWRAAGDGAAVSFTGTEATGGLSQALAVVTLAGTLLLLVLKASGRRVLAILLALVGIGAVVVGVLRLQPTSDAVRTKIREVSLIDQYALSATLWPWAFAASGLLLVAGAAALLLGAPHWATGAARYQRTVTDPADLAAADPAGIWKALDAGLDPTADQVGGNGRSDQDPDVRFARTGVTMDPSTRESPPSVQQGQGRHEPRDRGRSGPSASTPE